VEWCGECAGQPVGMVWTARFDRWHADSWGTEIVDAVVEGGISEKFDHGCDVCCRESRTVVYGHIILKTPDLVRSPKISRIEPE
jgi:hypothetical protein